MKIGSFNPYFAGIISGIFRPPARFFPAIPPFNAYYLAYLRELFIFKIIHTDSYGVSVTMDDNMFDHIQVTKDGETLKIGITSKIALITIADFRTTAREIVIRMPELTGLDISGASKGIVYGFETSEEMEIDVSGASELSFRDLATGDIDIDASGASFIQMTGSVQGMVVDISGASRIELVKLSADDAELSLSGASHIEGNLNADNIDFDLSGASTALLNGSSGDIRIDASGASRVDLPDLTVNNSDVSLTGASSASINIDGKLDMSLSGASLLNYAGTPKLGEINLSGSSTISNINE
ncbi:GIN domain-containing protein [Chloroflexota bacterium]